jgi:hypothetical protein
MSQPFDSCSEVDPNFDKVSDIEIFHFNDVYEVEPREREPVGGVSRFIQKIKSHPDAMVLFSGDWFSNSFQGQTSYILNRGVLTVWLHHL